MPWTVRSIPISIPGPAWSVSQPRGRREDSELLTGPTSSSPIPTLLLLPWLALAA